MTAYVVFIREKTIDPAELETYTQKVRPHLAQVPATVLAAYGRMESFEGPAPEGVVVLSFPSFDEATAWYHSDAYQALVVHRFKGAIYRGFVVDGRA